MTIAYDLSTLLPCHSMDLELLPLGAAIGPRQFLLTVELFSVTGDRVSPKDVNWSYSNALDTSFAYVPESDGAAPLGIPKALQSSVPFRRAVLTIVPWKLPKGGRQPEALFGTLTYRCHTGMDRSVVTGDTPVIYGVISPKEVDA